MKDQYDAISSDVEMRYGKSITDRNIDYVLSLYKERLVGKELDDNIPIPSLDATAETIMLIINHHDIPFEEICKRQKIKNVMLYLFVRAMNHYEEVRDFVKRLLQHHVKGLAPQTILAFLNMWDCIVKQERPSDFTKMIAYPEYADRIIDALHVLLNKKKGKDAALIMLCALDEGLITSAAHKDIKSEFPDIAKSAYNQYLQYNFYPNEKERVINLLRRRIGYKKEGEEIVFNDKQPSRKGWFHSLMNFIDQFTA